MTPRIFVSSTYYDLRHVRERLEKFIENYGFEPVLFENDKVTYEHGKPLDVSAYGEVNNCHLMLLIIGGRYGTASTDNTFEKKKYNEGYVSITRKELETAVEKNIPVYVFIDKNVYSEYQTYKENHEVFDKLLDGKLGEDFKFKFAHADDVNIFRFIDLIQARPIKSFEKVEEIEVYLKNQFSGLFYLYLDSLKKKSDDNKILTAVSELNNVSLRMNEMLTSVGRQILAANGHEEYQKTLDNQLRILIDFYAEKVEDGIEFEYHPWTNDETKQFDFTSISKIIVEKCLINKLDQLETKDNNKSFFEQIWDFQRQNEARLISELNKKLSRIDSKLRIRSFEIYELNNEYHKKVKPFLDKDLNRDYFYSKISKAIENAITDLPF